MKAILIRISTICTALVVLTACAGPLPLPIPPTPTPNPQAAVQTQNHQHGEGGINNVRLITRYGGPVAVTLTTTPATPAVEQPLLIDYMLKDGAGEPMSPSRLMVTHEKLMHLILVSQDLSTFQHLHPETGGDGQFEVNTTLPGAGNYILFNEFVTAQGTTQIERNVLTTGGAEGTDTPAALSTTLEQPQVWGDLKATLTTNSPRIRRRISTSFIVNVTTKDGQPVTDMEPYLGAVCHVVIVSADTKQFAHTHGDLPGGSMAGDMGSMDMGSMEMPAPPARFGPRLAFSHTFMQPGPYRVWAQFTYKGEVATFGFNVNVEK